MYRLLKGKEELSHRSGAMWVKRKRNLLPFKSASIKKKKVRGMHKQGRGICMVIGGKETNEWGRKMVTGGAAERECKHVNEDLEQKNSCKYVEKEEEEEERKGIAKDERK